MIPKIIHYCWFGYGEKPKLARKCIDSWKQYMPDYQIIEWNEDNFNINCNAYTRMCYNQKKFAFLSDYVRLVVIEQYGGLYFDTDVEVIRSFDDLLNYGLFLGFETDQFVNTGEGFGSEPHHPAVKKMISKYDPLLDGEHGTVGCPILNTAALLELGLIQNGKLQIFGDKKIVIFPAEYFNPNDSSTGKLTKTDNTYSIH